MNNDEHSCRNMIDIRNGVIRKFAKPNIMLHVADVIKKKKFSLIVANRAIKVTSRTIP